jgi:hypothetical protein
MDLSTLYPSQFKLMDKMFASSDLLKHVIYYADDIMIATNKSLSHHIEIIDKVLECFEKANIKIKAQKMSIARPEVEFLGIIWCKGMLHIPTARISAFKNILVPKTPKKSNLLSVPCLITDTLFLDLQS